MTSPADLPGLVAWYVADDFIGPVNAQVDSLRDRSPFGRAMTQATAAKRPLTVAGINGRRALSFDGVDDFLASSAPAGLGPSTLLVVVRVESQGGTGANAVIRSGNATQSLLFRARTPGISATTTFKPEWTASDVAFAGLAPQFSPLATEMVLAQDVSSPGSTPSNFWTDGASKGSEAHTATFVAGTSLLGIHGGGVSEPFKGLIYDICWFDRILTTIERADLNSYYQINYGLAVADYRFDDLIRNALMGKPR